MNYPETFLPVPGHPEYEVSDFGNVRSSCGIKQPYPIPTPRKYLGVGLFTGGKYSLVTVHSLVARAFLGPKPEGMEVCHCNGNSFDNRASNLRYDTHTGNMADANIKSFISKNKLQEFDIPIIRARILAGETYEDIALDYRVHRITIRNIDIKHTWKHIP